MSFYFCIVRPARSSHHLSDYLQLFKVLARSTLNSRPLVCQTILLMVSNPKTPFKNLCLSSQSPLLISIIRKSPHQSPQEKRKHKLGTLHFCFTQSLKCWGYMILLVTHIDKCSLLTHLKIISLSCSAICLSYTNDNSSPPNRIVMALRHQM